MAAGVTTVGNGPWGQACLVLGRMEAIAALAVIATRHARGEVRSPEALMRKMVELHRAGELRLDKSLFGLMDGPREDRRREERPDAGRRRQL
jgi:Replication protein C C-terminal region